MSQLLHPYSCYTAAVTHLSFLGSMLIRGSLVHTPRLGELEILHSYLIGNEVCLPSYNQTFSSLSCITEH